MRGQEYRLQNAKEFNVKGPVLLLREDRLMRDFVINIWELS